MEVSLDFLSGDSNSELFFLDFASTDIFKMEMFFFSGYSSKMLYLEFTVLVFVKTHVLEYPGSGSGIKFGQNSSASQEWVVRMFQVQNLIWALYELPWGSSLGIFWREQGSD